MANSLWLKILLFFLWRYSHDQATIIIIQMNFNNKICSDCGHDLFYSYSHNIIQRKDSMKGPSPIIPP